MDDVKDKFKDFVKKVNNPFSSSSSGKFKGQGRVLGSAPSSSASNSSSSGPSRSFNGIGSRSDPPPPALSIGKPKSSSPPKSNYRPDEFISKGPPKEFTPYDAIVSSGKRTTNGISLNVYECPVCSEPYRSEEEVSDHVETCLNNQLRGVDLVSKNSSLEADVGLRNEMVTQIGLFLSGDPSEASVEVVLKLLKNIVKEPENAKFRRIRMSNPKIKEALGTTTGGVELLEGVGFKLREEGEELWATMELPSEDQIILLKEATLLLEQRKPHDLPSTDPDKVDTPVEEIKKVIDRQVRVFFSVSESLAAKFELPESFYNLSAVELKREAELRRKKIADSQLLIPKSYKEKQAKAAKRKFKATVIRIQFPDGVVLQGVFMPWELTTVLYEFVSSSLKEPGLEFELLLPATPRRRVVPRFSQVGERTPTLEEEDLVPSALVKFRPIETDVAVFTGLCNELLEIGEPFTSGASLS